MEKYDLIIIGAGASGLFAASYASSSGLKVLLLEKMNRVGIKLSITGKGRCNICNTANQEEFFKHVGSNYRFLKFSFSKFYNTELLQYFENLGIKTITERGGRVFPESQKAIDVVNSLKSNILKNNGKIMYLNPMKNFILKNDKIIGVETKSGKFYANNFLLCTGGMSYPSTGSTGDGYRLAKTLGHNIIQPIPALNAIEIIGDIPKKLQGLSLKNISISVWINNKKKKEYFGEMIFTHFGISGPIVLTISKDFSREIYSKENITFLLDLKPVLDEKTLDKRLLREFESFGKKKIKSILKNLLPLKMINVVINEIGLDGEKLGNQINSTERKLLKKYLKGIKLKLKSARPISEAIITAGGVSLKEVISSEMKSKYYNNLYFSGEILDLDADTGGYNLQIAFSTAFIAVDSILHHKSYNNYL
jgi:predicted Rossmann fold flavoprotein